MQVLRARGSNARDPRKEASRHEENFHVGMDHNGCGTPYLGVPLTFGKGTKRS